LRRRRRRRRRSGSNLYPGFLTEVSRLRLLDRLVVFCDFGYGSKIFRSAYIACSLFYSLLKCLWRLLTDQKARQIEEGFCEAFRRGVWLGVN